MAHKRLDLGGQGCLLINNRDRSDFEAQEPRPRQGSKSKEKHKENKKMHRKNKEMHRERKGMHRINKEIYRESAGMHRESKGMHRKITECIGKVMKNA